MRLIIIGTITIHWRLAAEFVINLVIVLCNNVFYSSSTNCLLYQHLTSFFHSLQMIPFCLRYRICRSKWTTKQSWMTNVRPAGHLFWIHVICTLEHRWHSSKLENFVDQTMQRCRLFEDQMMFYGCICKDKWCTYDIQRRFGFKTWTILNNAQASFTEALKSMTATISEDSFVKSIRGYVQLIENHLQIYTF